MDAAVNGTVYERELKLILAGNEDKLGKVGWIREDKAKEALRMASHKIPTPSRVDVINLASPS